MMKKNSKKRTHESRKCFCFDGMIDPSSAVSHRPAGKRPPTNLGNLPKINGQKQKIKAISIIRRSFSSLSLKFWNFIVTLNTLNPAIYQELNDQDFTQLTFKWEMPAWVPVSDVTGRVEDRTLTGETIL